MSFGRLSKEAERNKMVTQSFKQYYFAVLQFSLKLYVFSNHVTFFLHSIAVTGLLFRNALN